ncbi:MAG: hypothetical protein V4510_09515 [bacterium]
MRRVARLLALACLLIAAIASAGCSSSAETVTHTTTKVLTTTVTNTTTRTVAPDVQPPGKHVCHMTITSDPQTRWTYAYNASWAAPAGGPMGFRQPSISVIPRNVWMSIDEAQWIWTEDVGAGNDQTTVLPVMFERTFVGCEAAPRGGARLAITADNTYVVFVNGHFVGVCGTGTYAASPSPIEDEAGCYTSVHTYELPAMESGVNQIVAYVWNQNSRGHLQFQLDL